VNYQCDIRVDQLRRHNKAMDGGFRFLGRFSEWEQEWVEQDTVKAAECGMQRASEHDSCMQPNSRVVPYVNDRLGV